MVVLSPPGIMRASTWAKTSDVRTWRKVNETCFCREADEADDEMEAPARRRSMRCSSKAPCNARTPTEMLSVFVMVMMVQSQEERGGRL